MGDRNSGHHDSHHDLAQIGSKPCTTKQFGALPLRLGPGIAGVDLATIAVLTTASPVPLLAFIGLDAAAIDLSLGGSLSKNAT
ncbi:hypothetical protein [Acidithrix ferrooxidans]|uniref:Uncharacterized protein n=1 Tax=Acidithrix ferrooxidans TaxID=1280514 RepID=A0A0D8HGL2_9ACTN|nr:hypothetical protein [Acidithrix ferrooxidans]KJF16897.1 hypothetical protein AXFE_22520 [Acidithrix ferrooxidans]